MSKSVEGSPPNILLIVSDTFRADLLIGGFQVRHGVRCRIPNLGRLAKEGVLFTRFYHASFPTVPTRHDLLTGRFTFTYAGWQPLPKEELVLPDILRQAGYVSMLIADTPHMFREGFNYDRGFDAWDWIRGQENDRYRTDPEDVRLPCSPEKLRNVETPTQHMRNNALRFAEEDWIPSRTSSAAKKWLERNYKRRFFLYLDFFDPHEPWDPPQYYVDEYDPGYVGDEVTYPAYDTCDYLSQKELEHCRAMYAGEATFVDKCIGEVIQKVEQLGLTENTAIIFFSDHGFYIGEHGLIGKARISSRGLGYTPLYEELAHVPLVVRLPDSMGTAKGSTIDNLVQTPDITATIVDLAGLEYKAGTKLTLPIRDTEGIIYPTDIESSIEGMSVLPLVRGESVPWREYAVSAPGFVPMAALQAGLRPTISSKEYSLVLATDTYPTSEEPTEYTMVIDGHPRLFRAISRSDTELYHLPSDPKQAHNIIEEKKDVALRMRQEFVRILRDLKADQDAIDPWLKCKRLD
jgi:arylsulfatase A-like enzyme